MTPSALTVFEYSFLPQVLHTSWNIGGGEGGRMRTKQRRGGRKRERKKVRIKEKKKHRS
jgi:hypothetical protein